eukprot:m.176791 g.176791  ORF g.176791 m.176791 type:complete len:188 (+) comp21390_c1_seq2:53-616(+)
MGKDEARVYVGKLPTRCHEKDLEDLFKKFGTIESVDLKNGGYGFVQFLDERDAADAVRDMDGFRFEGERLLVQHSRRNRGGSNTGCFTCGSMSHWARDCPDSRDGGRGGSMGGGPPRRDDYPRYRDRRRSRSPRGRSRSPPRRSRSPRRSPSPRRRSLSPRRRSPSPRRSPRSPRRSRSRTPPRRVD